MKQHWTLQQIGTTAGKPWYALQRHATGGIEYQATGYFAEMQALAGQLGISPERLPAITEEEFLKRSEAN